MTRVYYIRIVIYEKEETENELERAIQLLNMIRSYDSPQCRATEVMNVMRLHVEK